MLFTWALHSSPEDIWEKPCSIEKYVNQINQRYAFNSIVQYGEKENFNVTEFKNRQDGAICLSVTQYK